MVVVVIVFVVVTLFVVIVVVVEVIVVVVVVVVLVFSLLQPGSNLVILACNPISHNNTVLIKDCLNHETNKSG